ncbi:MAG: creatininase family protein [Candidatus Aminicenantes bacterium]|nr:creatininase family protein [Candidatus Aminicenantes bacterium]
MTKKNKPLSGKKIDSLLSLKCLYRLEVGPVVLKPRRLSAPYRVIWGNEKRTFDLVYSYQENIFDPQDPVSVNLAGMIAAQVALNYGLFFEEIVFHGIFDETDKRFITAMMENTAREIYVKKFLEINPFLTGTTVSLPPQKKNNYVQAKIRFSRSGLKPGKKNAAKPSWRSDPSLFAVLSSGGKDSLLSFGLLKELKKEVHPIFINESGRHWFTAINAHRYFSSTYPETAKVWTNSDRLFSWMLRFLPFIRPDFHSIRSDEYPIRLWTVAVFIFGALPLLWKRGIGRLIIGDEYDTTSRTKTNNIPHFDGLYDQSRYFDNALTRYYIQKQWNIHQFSLLRPLSEMLIEKILVTRYPDLQQHQVSCHAAHKEKNRIHPCGRCEKCRRIVGMLTAFDGNPSRCGYSPVQINQCLEDIPLKGVHQESPGAEHMLYLLHQKGRIPLKSGMLKAKAHPEIMSLRFDTEKSPLNTVPSDLRIHLMNIFREHASGILKKEKNRWVQFDPQTEPAFFSPSPFESLSRQMISASEIPAGIPSHILGELTWPEAEARFKEVDVGLLPVGSIEQHGPHLPLDTDAYDAEYLSKHVAEACSHPKPLVFPLIPYGVSYHHEDFSGTLSISPDTLSRLVYDVGMSASRNGITKLVIINGHGGNVPALHFAAQMINRDARIFTCVETGETSEKDIIELTDTPNDVHAGEIETSTVLASRPEAVRKNKIKKFIPRFSIRYLNFSSKRSVDWNARISRISPYGVLGDPTKASREKGEKMWELMIIHLVEFIEELKSLTLEEIHHKKY